MVWKARVGWPRKEIRERCEFVFKGLQALAIVGGAFWGIWTYTASTTRELRKPYDEKQLNLYLDVARVVAHLAANPASPDRAKLEARFWELYWGELAFVESLTRDEKPGGPPSVETLMVDFCASYFKEKCTATDPNLSKAINLSHHASGEIRRRWEVKPRTRSD